MCDKCTSDCSCERCVRFTSLWICSSHCWSLKSKHGASESFVCPRLSVWPPLSSRHVWPFPPVSPVSGCYILQPEHLFRGFAWCCCVWMLLKWPLVQFSLVAPLFSLSVSQGHLFHVRLQKKSQQSSSLFFFTVKSFLFNHKQPHQMKSLKAPLCSVY